jgi:hypothetical protein
VALAVTACLERRSNFTPVVYTCGVSVLQELRRTKAVLGGFQSFESTQNHGSEKAGVAVQLRPWPPHSKALSSPQNSNLFHYCSNKKSNGPVGVCLNTHRFGISLRSHRGHRQNRSGPIAGIRDEPDSTPNRVVLFSSTDLS